MSYLSAQGTVARVLLVTTDNNLGDKLIVDMEGIGVELELVVVANLIDFSQPIEEFDCFITDVPSEECSKLDRHSGVAQLPSDRQIVLIDQHMGHRQQKYLRDLLGLADLLAKPFASIELTCRIVSVIRKARPSKFFSVQKDITRQGSLTANEKKLFNYLLMNAGALVTNSMILDQVWGLAHDSASTMLLETHMTLLGERLNPEGLFHLAAINSTGYRLTLIVA